ncbi:hypothetical protein CRM22_007839 [Opisthorchis felineus]|uniref:Uncharacterized protein n=1 Tax=Opisthorchis felineus TaxID=147828 RepID=A0A4S2LEN7_OPIFE|nr:hypothetical protein CRM22_007839 [Opisthorchis felineus]
MHIIYMKCTQIDLWFPPIGVFYDPGLIPQYHSLCLIQRPFKLSHQSPNLGVKSIDVHPILDLRTGKTGCSATRSPRVPGALEGKWNEISSLTHYDVIFATAISTLFTGPAGCIPTFPHFLSNVFGA